MIIKIELDDGTSQILDISPSTTAGEVLEQLVKYRRICNPTLELDHSEICLTSENLRRGPLQTRLYMANSIMSPDRLEGEIFLARGFQGQKSKYQANVHQLSEFTRLMNLFSAELTIFTSNKSNSQSIIDRASFGQNGSSIPDSPQLSENLPQAIDELGREYQIFLQRCRQRFTETLNYPPTSAHMDYIRRACGTSIS